MYLKGFLKKNLMKLHQDSKDYRLLTNLVNFDLLFAALFL